MLYQPDSEVRLEVRLENETVWLSIEEMSQLFGRDISVIGKFAMSSRKVNCLKRQFRQWANKVLKDYLLRGYSVNQRLEQIDTRIQA